MKRKYYNLESIIFCILAVIWFLILVVLYIYNNNYKVIDEMDSNGIEVTFCLDSVSLNEEKYFCIEGWSCILGESIESVNISVILWNQEKQIGYVIPTNLVKRPDVTAHFQDGFNYDNSGFISYVKKDRLKKGEKYQIYIRYQNNEQDEFKFMGEVLEG